MRSTISMQTLRSVSVITLCWLGSTTAQCYTYHEVQVDQTMQIRSPNFPILYPADAHCTWRVVTEPGAQLRLECHNFNLPSSDGCSMDHVAVSQIGALFSPNTQFFCGKMNISLDSVENKLSLKLVARGSKKRGYFSCTVTAFQNLVGLPSLPLPTPKLPCDCGIRRSSSRIVGGVEAGINEFPMMAALIDSLLRVLYCGATLIAPEFVLTAAHCLRLKTPDMVAVLVGDHDITTDSDTDSSELIQAGEFFPHPQYDARTQEHDIALVRLSEPATYNDDVGSACIPFNFARMSLADKDVIALGWGTTESTWPMSAKLRLTYLGVQNDDQCRAAYPGDVITTKQMCTFGENADACQFDSGGPLLYQDPSTGNLFVVGVISYGSGCGTDSPNVNTRVDAYADWIEKTTTGIASFCVK